MSTYARHFKAYFDENNRGRCDIFALNLSVGRPDTSTDLPITKFSFDEADELVRRVEKSNENLKQQMLDKSESDNDEYMKSLEQERRDYQDKLQSLQARIQSLNK